MLNIHCNISNYVIIILLRYRGKVLLDANIDMINYIVCCVYKNCKHAPTFLCFGTVSVYFQKPVESTANSIN